MSQKTISEELFEEFCKQNSIQFFRIKESIEQQPDYEVFIKGQKIIVEVKEIVPNEVEKKAIENLKEKGGTGVMSDEPGSKIRNKISKASNQLKASKEYPSLLVLYDTFEEKISSHLSEYDILVGMYGLHTLEFVQNEDGETSYVGEVFGKKKKMSLNRGSTISGVGVLKKYFKNYIQLDIYHNFYSDVPIEISLQDNFELINQFKVKSNPSEGFTEWIKI